MLNEELIIAKWAADMYDQEVTETDDVDFILSLIGETPKRILEVCCGSGRIMAPLARAGHDVSGFDADAFMLAKIAAKADGLKNIRWREADAVNGDWGVGYDAVVLAGNILYNIVSDMDYAKAQELFIRKAASALVPGGYVCIDYQPGGHRLTQREPSRKDDRDLVVWDGTDADGNSGRMILLAGGYDAGTGLHSFIRRYEMTLRSGETFTRDIPCQKHFASLERLHGWLGGAGFKVEREYADCKRGPIDDKSSRVIILARKG